MSNNEEKKDNMINKIKEQTSDMENWPEWKRDINLTDASTFTINSLMVDTNNGSDETK